MDFIKLPDAEEQTRAPKRARPEKFDREKEEQLRQQNVKKLAVLGEEDGSVKRLETLVFGTEDELLERLAEVMLAPDSVQKASNLTFNSHNLNNLRSTANFKTFL